MAKHKDIFVPLACKKSLAKASVHSNQRCDSPSINLKEYGAYHA
jgi:hypothetical protein